MSVKGEDLWENFRPSIHTSYFSSFFVLRTEVVINRQRAVVESDGKGWLTLKSRYPEVGVTFGSLVADISSILQSHGMEGVTKYYCEEVPLFEVQVSSQKDLKRLLELKEIIKKELSLKIAAQMVAKLQSSGASIPPPGLHVLVYPDIYLLTMDSHQMGRSVTKVTKENLASCIALCSSSNHIDFEVLFREYRADLNNVDVDEGIRFSCWYQL